MSPVLAISEDSFGPERPVRCGRNEVRSALLRRPLVRSDAADMLKRRLKQAGLPAHYSPHSFRATGITNFLENDGRPQGPTLPQAGSASHLGRYQEKELVGDFKNGGGELRPKGDPEQVRVHDFVIPELGRVTPYGVYDVGKNRGWVSVGVDHDTATFAVESIRRWWRSMGKPVYRQAQRLLITADSGGSNGARVRLWKLELQQFADETGLHISVCHLPPGTSKWNKIEHRLFSFISQNWRGKPLVSHEVIVNLISATTTQTGLKVRAKLDTSSYPPGAKVSN